MKPCLSHTAAVEEMMVVRTSATNWVEPKFILHMSVFLIELNLKKCIFLQIKKLFLDFA